MAVKLGPGTLKIGETGTEVDASCLLNNAKITNTKDEADSTTKLCGTVVPGAVTYTYALEGNVDIDPAEASGLFMMCANNAGQPVPFVFVPNTADGTQASGELVLDPLDFGADNYGDDMTSDFSFTIVDKPIYGPAGAPLDVAHAHAVGDVADDVADDVELVDA